jgi:cobalt-zinc-cadmium efflux system outer membrane protein
MIEPGDLYMLILLMSTAVLVGTQDTLVVSLDAAVQRALEVSPAVRAAEAAIAAPRGARAEAIWPFPVNPTLDFARVRRRSADGTSYDREFGIGGEIQIAGQGFIRAGAAGKRITAAEERVGNVVRTTALETRLAFMTLISAQRRKALVDSAAQFMDRLVRVARARLDAGEINGLDYNAALLQAARQRSAAERTRGDRIAAASDLARLMALPQDSVPRAATAPLLPAITLPPEEQLIGLALGRRPDYRAGLLERDAANQQVTAANLDGWIPALQLGAVAGREDGTDDLLGFSIGLAIPLFRRGQAERGLAVAERAAAEATLEATQRRIQAEIIAAVGRYERALAAERLFAEEVLEAARENVQLTERAFDEGKVGIADLIVLQSAAVEAQLEYVAVREEAYTGWFELAAALDTDPADVARIVGGQP